MVCTCAAIERAQFEMAAGLDLAAAMKNFGAVMSELALVMKLHRWLTSADQVVGMTVPAPVVGRLAEPVRGLLVQVDLHRGRPPYVVLRDDHGAEIPVQPETVRKFLPPIPVPEGEMATVATMCGGCGQNQPMIGQRFIQHVNERTGRSCPGDATIPALISEGAGE